MLSFDRIMGIIPATFLLCAISGLITGSGSEVCRGLSCYSAQDWSRACVGAHCQGRTDTPALRRQQHVHPRTGPVYPSSQQDARLNQRPAQSTPLAPYTIIQPHQQHAGSDGSRRTNPRTLTAEVFHPRCAGGTCPSAVSQRPTSDESAARECKGIGCKLPPRMRQKQKPCIGEGCSAHAGDEARGGSSPALVTDRAAQYLDELPDFGLERGPWIQLACDIKPGQSHHEWLNRSRIKTIRVLVLSFTTGSNEVPSEDALVLQLQLSESQERLVEALRGQQDEIKELQRVLGEQQGALLGQQREILEQQKRMFEQMEQVRLIRKLTT